MAGRPPKPVKILEMEGRSHRTKRELLQRKKGEDSTLSGRKLIESKEVKENPEAHKEFRMLVRLLDSVDKNDALYSEVINRYCLLKAECISLTARRDALSRAADELPDHKGEMEYEDYMKAMTDASKSIIALDRQIQDKRKMMFSIERENIMTIASALRSVPRQQEKKSNPLMEALNG